MLFSPIYFTAGIVFYIPVFTTILWNKKEKLCLQKRTTGAIAIAKKKTKRDLQAVKARRTRAIQGKYFEKMNGKRCFFEHLFIFKILVCR